MSAADAMAALVSGEDAAIYAYSVAGARVAGAKRRRALTALDSHQSHRDRAASIIVAAGGTPPGSAVAYTLPAPVDSPSVAKSLMALVDNRLVGLYADAASGLEGAERRWAVRAAIECATRAVTWGTEPQAFPVGDSSIPVASTAPTASAGASAVASPSGTAVGASATPSPTPSVQ